MNLYLLVIIALLAYILYDLHGLIGLYRKKLQEEESLKTEKMWVHSTVNPLFTEQQIFDRNKIAEKWRRISNSLSESVGRQKKDELQEHGNIHNAGTFNPSDALKIAAAQFAVAHCNATKAFKDYWGMIDANIAILNGQDRQKISEEFYEQEGYGSYPYFVEVDEIDMETMNAEMSAWYKKYLSN